MVECIISNYRYDFGQFKRKHGCTVVKNTMGNHSDEGWESKIGEDAVSKCACSDAFNAIVKTNGSSERTIEGKITNPPE
jgi:hypothetical protein